MESSDSVRSIKVEISIAEFAVADPPLMRFLLTTSPSRVIAIISGSAARALSASLKFSTATIPCKRCLMASEISSDETKEESAVNPFGIVLLIPLKPESITNNSLCPAESRFNRFSAEIAAPLSATTTESAKGPSAAETATSHPREIVINEANLPRDLMPLESTVAEPSLETKLSCKAFNLPSSAALLFAAAISRAVSKSKSDLALCNLLLALSYSPSSPTSPASREEI